MTKEKKNTKPLSKCLREKKRYIKFKIITEQELKESEINETINETLTTLYGDYGVAKQRIRLMNWNEKQKTGIIRCTLNSLDQTITGLMFTCQTKQKKIIPKIIKISGTIKKLKNEQKKD